MNWKEIYNHTILFISKISVAKIIDCSSNYYQKVVEAEENIGEGMIGFQMMADMYKQEIDNIENSLNQDGKYVGNTDTNKISTR